jgi:hypothetical protein
MHSNPMPLWRKILVLATGIQMLVLVTAAPLLGPRLALAQESEEIQIDQDPPATSGDPLEQAREYLRSAEYDKAVAVLETHIEDSSGDPEALEPAYLLLINTYALLSNDFRSRGDFVTSELYLDRAEESILECLQQPGLSHVRAVPEVDYPPEMVALFRATRASIFGSFEVTSLDPPDAVVMIDDVPVPVPAGSEFPKIENVPVGEHVLTVEADGYKTFTEEITIRPSTAMARELDLSKNRGFMWFASRGAVVAGVVAIAFLAGSGSGGDDTVPETELPDPPAPPSSP